MGVVRERFSYGLPINEFDDDATPSGLLADYAVGVGHSPHDPALAAWEGLKTNGQSFNRYPSAEVRACFYLPETVFLLTFA